MLDGKKCLSAVSARFSDIILASMCGFCLCLCLWFLDIVPASMFGCVVVWLCGYRFLDIVPASMCGCQSGRCLPRSSLCVSSPWKALEKWMMTFIFIFGFSFSTNLLFFFRQTDFSQTISWQSDHWLWPTTIWQSDSRQSELLTLTHHNLTSHGCMAAEYCHQGVLADITCGLGVK